MPLCYDLYCMKWTLCIVGLEDVGRCRGILWPGRWDLFRGERDVAVLLSVPGWLCVRNCVSVCACVQVCTCVTVCPCSSCVLEFKPVYPPQKSCYGPFTFWNEKQIQIQGQFLSPIICRHFQIKINFRSPCCSPLGLKYFPFECVWWKVFSAQPQRGGVLRGWQLRERACMCVYACVCVSLEHLGNLRWKRAVDADLSCPALLCLFRTESECFILKTDNITAGERVCTYARAGADTHHPRKRLSVVVHVCLWCVLSEALFVLLPMLDQVGWNLRHPADGSDTVAEGGYWSVSVPYRQHLRDSG